MLKKGPLNPLNSALPKGIVYHICDIYIEELVKTQDDQPFFNLDIQIFSKILTPFFFQLTHGDKKVLNRLRNHLLIPIADGWKDDLNEIFNETDTPSEEDLEIAKKLYIHIDTFTNYILKLGLNKSTDDINRSTIYNIKDTFSTSLEYLKNILNKHEIEIPNTIQIEIDDNSMIINEIQEKYKQETDEETEPKEDHEKKKSNKKKAPKENDHPLQKKQPIKPNNPSNKTPKRDPRKKERKTLI